MNDIDYDLIVENIDKMVNVLEFDAMRSPGKAKMNSQHLHSLYYLKEVYAKKTKKPSKKEA